MQLKLVSSRTASLTAAGIICIVYGNIEMCIDDLVSAYYSFLHQTDVALRVALSAAHAGQMAKQPGAGRGRVCVHPGKGVYPVLLPLGVCGWVPPHRVLCMANASGSLIDQARCPRHGALLGANQGRGPRPGRK